MAQKSLLLLIYLLSLIWAYDCPPLYTGLNWSEYMGQWDVLCNGCSGPGPNYCSACINHAQFDAYRVCMCSSGYSGVECSVTTTYTYNGVCDPRCQNGCYGPTSAYCNACVIHAYMYQGSCICESNWYGDSCGMIGTLTGNYNCDGRCNGCTGPTNSDCVVCVTYANNINGQCICREGYSGYACQYTPYSFNYNQTAGYQPTISNDINGDGFPDSPAGYDINGDGWADIPYSYPSSTYPYDINNDGTVDGYIHGYATPGFSPDVNMDGVPDIYQSPVGADLNNDGIPDAYAGYGAHGYGSYGDINANEIPDGFENHLDTNMNNIPDYAEAPRGYPYGTDYNNNSVPDQYEIYQHDSNYNNVPDVFEGAHGYTGQNYYNDSNLNGVPDGHEYYSTFNGFSNYPYTGTDVNANSVPDHMEGYIPGSSYRPTDYNMNRIPDQLEGYGTGSLFDYNGNGVPDSQEVSGYYGPIGDVNVNGIPDFAEVGSSYGTDYNRNGIADHAEGYQYGTDYNNNGILDSLEHHPYGTDLNLNGIIDQHEQSSYGYDYNMNGISDANPSYTAYGQSPSNPFSTGYGYMPYPDINRNNIHDGIEVGNSYFSSGDANLNGVPDGWEFGTDLNRNNIPDHVENYSFGYRPTDINNNGIHDGFEVSNPYYTGGDANLNGVPDGYEFGNDVNLNNIPDHLENAANYSFGYRPSQDLNNNSINDVQEGYGYAYGHVNNGQDINSNGIPDSVEYAGYNHDVNYNGISDSYEYGPSGYLTNADYNLNGIPDAQEQLYNSHPLNNPYGNINYGMDMNNNQINDFAEGYRSPYLPTYGDRNANGVNDAAEIGYLAGPYASGYNTLDVNMNGIPDTQEMGYTPPSFYDLNQNGVPDSVEQGYAYGDTNANGIPDVYEGYGINIDMNMNSIPDYIEYATDVNANGTPDNLERGHPQDFNGNGIPDNQEAYHPYNPLDQNMDGIIDYNGLYGGYGSPYHLDYNGNGIPDIHEDVYGMPVIDANGDGIPDTGYYGYNAVDYNMDGRADHYGYSYGDMNQDGIPDAAQVPYSYSTAYKTMTGIPYTQGYSPYVNAPYSYPDTTNPSFISNRYNQYPNNMPLQMIPGAGYYYQPGYGIPTADNPAQGYYLTRFCSPKCSLSAGGCTGRSAGDCAACTNHASKNADGFCICDPYWSGVDCSVRSTFILCDPKCADCSGPGANQCISCVPHARLDSSGNCAWDENWAQEDCSEYQGTCDMKCQGCHGPGVYNCDMCIANAYVNTYGSCLCGGGWTGLACTIFTGACDPKCLACTGPDADQWVQCQPSAYRNIYGTCQCIEGWEGDSCSIYSGVCDVKCEICIGPYPTSCQTCVANANINLETQICECDENWSGDTCNKYSGTCDGTCDPDLGCNGPGNGDCVQCREHAVWSDHCWCINPWSGDDCSTWGGDCDPRCAAGQCTGPDPSDCTSCNSNASFVDGACRCLSGVDGEPFAYSGPGCEFFSGKCADGCLLCAADDATVCYSCFENAYYSSSDNSCTCVQEYTGKGCNIPVTSYCGPMCITCDESLSSCLQCVDNAYFNSVTGDCECNSSYADMNDCSVYHGTCDPKCQGGLCSGPFSSDCNSWATGYAYRTLNYECACYPDWGGDDCKLYIGRCNPKCLTCDDPDDWVDFQPFASDAETCETGWYGPSCNLYNGECADPLCLVCNNPTGCVSCVPNSYHDEDGCTCDEQLWTNSDHYCNVWSDDTQCAHACKTCVGPDPLDCHECEDNAYRLPNGSCACKPYWWGLTCQKYGGPCPQNCVACSDPTTCTLCVSEATLSSGSCDCPENFSGEDCFYYSGDCSDDNCSSCPQDEDYCILCASNYYADSDASCQIIEPDEYTGTCNDICGPNPLGDGCTGPDPGDCAVCVDNASFYGGICMCDLGWRGPSCGYWGGKCHPNCPGACLGPTDEDCDLCQNGNAPSEGNGCVWEPGWFGFRCKLYNGPCAPECEDCIDDTLGGCIKLFPYYELDAYPNVDAICLDGYTEVNAGHCTYTGACAITCGTSIGTMGPDACNGPLRSDCLMCDSNAFRDLDGNCQCLPNWSENETSGNCSRFSGVCPPSCADCNSEDGGCDDWVTNAASDTDPVTGLSICVCNEDYTGLACEVYNGVCNTACSTCFGPNDTDCIICAINYAISNDSDQCVCSTGYDTATCSIWEGACAPACACDPSDVTCNACPLGNAPWQCERCANNAYRTRYGWWVCSEYFSGDYCDLFTGACAPSCMICSGFGQCDQCKTHTDNSMYCNCLSGWGGPDCQIYSDVCHELCYGCLGPSVYDCIQCTINAAFNSAGACECIEGWEIQNGVQGIDATGDPILVDNVGRTCLRKVWNCYPTCETCFGPGINECLTCKDGYAVPNSLTTGGIRDSFICIACHWSCKTCSLAQSEDSCTTCIDGWTLENSFCVPCHESCKTCEATSDMNVSIWGANICLTCFDDSYLNAQNVCVCLYGKVRNEQYGDRCVDACPTGTYTCAEKGNGLTDRCFDYNQAVGTCVDQYTTYSQWYLSTSRRLHGRELGNSAWNKDGPSDNYEVEDMGNMHRTKDIWYFDGSSSVRIKDFSHYYSFWISMFVQANNAGATLFSGDIEIKGDTFEIGDINDWPNYPIYGQDSRVVPMDIYISSGLYVVMQIGNDVWSSGLSNAGANAYQYTLGEWQQFTFSVTGRIAGQKDLDAGGRITRADSEDTFTTIIQQNNNINWSPTSQNLLKTDYYIGSYYGHSNRLQGKMKFFWFENGDRSDPVFGTCGGCSNGLCDVHDCCTEDYCELTQYLSDTGCADCDSSCTLGCNDANACDHCDRSCKTCGGTASNQCYTCHANAYLITNITGMSYCECQVGYQGNSWDCQPICRDDNCCECRGPGIGECYKCNEGYRLANTAPSQCVLCAMDTWQYQDDTCPRDSRLPAGDDDCGTNQWWDETNMTCVYCSVGCTDWHNGSGTNLHWASCDTGLIFYPDSEICMSYCPTGYKLNNNQCVAGETNNVANGGLEVIVLFQFDQSSAISTRSWQYSGSWDNTSGTTGTSHSWDVKIYGGENETSTSVSDPYLTAERGIYLDGSHCYMSVSGLTLPFRFRMFSWLRPLKSGAIYSGSEITGTDTHHSYHWGIRKNDLEFDHRELGGYWKTETGSVGINSWNFVEMKAEWNENDQVGTIAFGVNEIGNSAIFHLKHPILDYDDVRYKNRLGAVEQQQTLIYHFKGFLTEFGVELGFYGSETQRVSFVDLGRDCDCGLDFCYNRSFNDLMVNCWSSCDAQTYVSGTSCLPCPTWCTKGCIDNGCTSS